MSELSLLKPHQEVLLEEILPEFEKIDGEIDFFMTFPRHDIIVNPRNRKVSQDLWTNLSKGDFEIFKGQGFLYKAAEGIYRTNKALIINFIKNSLSEKKSNSYLAPEVQETAWKLVEAQKANKIDVIFELIDVTSGSDKTRREYARGLGIEDSVDIPNINHLSDLAYFGLLEMERSSKKIKVRLLPSLRHAVENNFQSDLIEDNDFGEIGTQLDHASLRQIKKFLMSHVQTLSERKTIVNNAFYGTPLSSLIELEGMPRVFCSHLVTETLRYGVLQKDNDHAIFRLLAEIRDIVGIDKQADIDKIAEKVRMQNP